MKYGVGVFLAAACIIILRVHYYGALALCIPLCAIFFLTIAILVNPVSSFSKKIFANQRFADGLGMLIMFIAVGGVITALYSGNQFYCDYLLSHEVTSVTGIIKEEGHVGKRGTKTWIYEYTYQNKTYSDDMLAEGTDFVLNDTFKLKISTIDPTVNRLVE